MEIKMALPPGIDREHRLLHFQGIAPTRASYSMDVVVEWDGGDRTEAVGAIHSYGFGSGMDAQGRVELGQPGGTSSVERPPRFDAFVELPEAVAERIANSPGAKLAGVIGRIDGEEEPGQIFSVDRITAETV